MIGDMVYIICVNVCMYGWMDVYFYEWRSNRVLVRLGWDTLIGCLHVCLYLCMCACIAELTYVEGNMI